MFEFLKKLFGFADLNQDGKVNSDDATVLAQAAKTEVKKVVDPVIKTAKKSVAEAKKDGKVTIDEVKTIAKNVSAAAKKAADVNKDGKIGTGDASALAKKVVKTATKKPAKPKKPQTTS